MTLQEACKNDAFWEEVTKWWKFIQQNRGQRAELRRAKSPMEVYVSSAFRNGFVNPLKVEGFSFSEPELEKLAFGIGLLSHLLSMHYGYEHFAATFAKHGRGSKDMRDVRFRKLLAVRDNCMDELYTMLVRLITLADNQGNIKGIVHNVMCWNDQNRMEWAKNYFPNRKDA